MTAEEYKPIIKAQMNYSPEMMQSFETCITICAEILEERDRVTAQYIAEGAKPTIDFQTEKKTSNPKINPLLKTMQELNAQALLYLRDLGISPAGRRKLQGQALPEKPRKTESDIMQEIRAKCGVKNTAKE